MIISLLNVAEFFSFRLLFECDIVASVSVVDLIHVDYEIYCRAGTQAGFFFFFLETKPNPVIIYSFLKRTFLVWSSIHILHVTANFYLFKCLTHALRWISYSTSSTWSFFWWCYRRFYLIFVLFRCSVSLITICLVNFFYIFLLTTLNDLKIKTKHCLRC